MFGCRMRDVGGDGWFEISSHWSGGGDNDNEVDVDSGGDISFNLSS